MSGTVIAQIGNRQVGNRISDRYEVLERLGGGSGGEVYRVFDEHLRTEVALKLFEPLQGQPATWDEAQALKKLQSQYLLPVYNADIASGTDIRYITMPVMDGDLESAAAPFGADVAKAVHWGQQLGYGLERIHAAGLLHRDVKPGNAFADNGNNVLLGDLGFAARTDGDGYTAANGTLATVAPEVLSTDKCSVASDVYSLAATLFYLLSGQYPNGPIAVRPTARRERILQAQFDKLRDIAPHVSQRLGSVVERGLSIDPAARPRSAQELANELAQCSHPHRPWRRVTPHDGHHQCFEGGATNTAKAVSVCAVQDERRRYSIEVRHPAGRRARQHEKGGVQPESLPAALRTVLRNLK
ncbi:serine/threonine-protein kinase [Streptomyces goshikiensis]|uniref:serine/threonine-protein kinase n=1 Tax=Streptomyces goshikiensis TaxID=1942 RepID=UPI002ADF8BC5|nr:serine/threonine-protein kinase [Streptomyces goshikiensis]